VIGPGPILASVARVLDDARHALAILDARRELLAWHLRRTHPGRVGGWWS
jgi:hypothetical protein